MNQDIAIGADIGGSHISCAAVDLSRGIVLDNQAQASEIISTWASCVRDAIEKVSIEKVRGIGFAMPGPFDYVKGISYIRGVSKYENLYGVDITKAIRTYLGLQDTFGIRYMNDASSFAVGEAWAGLGADYRKVMCITLGTGLGSAFISDKIPVVDGPTVPEIGCIYHLPYGGSIADDHFSTRWFLKMFREKTGVQLEGVKELVQREEEREIVDNLFATFGYELGGFLAPWLKKFGAEILVVGGNISYAYDRFGQIFEERLKKENWDHKIELSELKEDAALLGSAYLFDPYFWKAVQHALPLM
jgi:glucokinase